MEQAILYTDLLLFFVNYLLFFILEKRFRNKNWSTKPGFSERWSHQAKPTIGGLGFFITVLGTVIFQYFVLGEMGNWFLWTAVCVAFATGFIDDLHGLNPLTKLSGQLVCAAILLLGIPVIPLAGNIWMDKIITIIWIVGIMNSINMLDNMDAVASVPALAILLFFTVTSIDLNAAEFPLYLFMAGSVMAFLFFNWPPSRIFMGDSGSMVLGIILAYGGIQFTWLAGHHHESVHWYDRVGLTLLVFAIPLADTITVTINRLLHRISPSVGGRDHTTHNLVYSGLKPSRVPLLFAIISVMQLTLWWLFSDPSLYEKMNWSLPPRVGRVLSSWSFPVWWLGTLFFLCYFLTVFILSRINLSKGKYSYAK